jgi:NAD(P)-dependent dehydrogenase (short-subunit alcohol dehydrogenase family)
MRRRKLGSSRSPRTLSGELLPRGVRVIAVIPGPIATPLHGNLDMGEAEIAGLVAQIPARRRGLLQCTGGDRNGSRATLSPLVR